MTGRKPRPLWPLLTAALIGLPVLYVASYGPVVWAYHHWIGLIDPVEPAGQLFDAVYGPIHWLLKSGPKPVSDTLIWYANIF